MKPVRSKLILASFTVAVIQTVFGLRSSALAADKRNADYAQVLPADNTAGVFVVENLFKTSAFDEQSPVGKLLATPAVKIWKDDLLPSHFPDIKEVFGVTSKDLPRLFSGKAALAVMIKNGDGATRSTMAGVSADKAKDEDTAENASGGFSMQFDVLGLIEFLGSAAEFEDFADKFEADARKDAGNDIKRERVEGVTLRTIEFAHPFPPETEKRTLLLALYNDTIILASNRAQLLDTIHGLSRGVTTNPLSGRSDYLAVKKEMGANDGFLFANLTVLMPLVRDLFKKGFEEGNKANPAARAMIDPKTVVDALALENFSSLYGSITITEQQVEGRYGLTWKDQVGLAKLLQFGRTPVSVPAYASADYKGIDVSTADYPAVWDAGDSIVRAAFPAAYPMIGMGIATNPQAQELVAKLRKGILDNLEQEMVSLTGFPTAAPADDEIPGKVVVLRVKDAVAAQAAIEALVSKVGEMQGRAAVKPDVRDYLGTKIYRLPLPPGMFPGQTPASADDDGDDNNDDGDKSDDGDKKGDEDKSDTKDSADEAEPAKPETTYLTYAFVDDRVIFSLGAAPFIEGVIANLQKPGRPIAEGKFKDELADIPGTPCSLAYGDVSTYLMGMINEGLRTGYYKKAKLTNADLVKARDAAKDLHYFWAGKSYYSPGGFFGRIVLAEDKGTSN